MKAKILVYTFCLFFFPGCAARMAQQEIDTFNEQVIAFQQASEFMRLEKLRRISKCRGAENIFTKLSQPGGVPDSQLNAVLDYLRHAYIVQKYMNEKRVTAETALSVMGDLVYPPLLPPSSIRSMGVFWIWVCHSMSRPPTGATNLLMTLSSIGNQERTGEKLSEGN